MKRDILIVGCAISAGVHGALTPEHFREGAWAGGGFLVATVLLGALAVVLTRRPDDTRVFAAAALTLVGLLVSYALAITTGVPLLHPEVEAVDGVALATKAIEVAALVAAVMSINTKGTLTWTRHGRTVPSLSR
jgi:CHASE2 domain-containing sensor protein